MSLFMCLCFSHPCACRVRGKKIAALDLCLSHGSHHLMEIKHFLSHAPAMAQMKAIRMNIQCIMDDSFLESVRGPCLEEVILPFDMNQFTLSAIDKLGE